jgi:hypothetical protein
VCWLRRVRPPTRRQSRWDFVVSGVWAHE